MQVPTGANRAYVDLLKLGIAVRSGDALRLPGFLRITRWDAGRERRGARGVREAAAKLEVVLSIRVRQGDESDRDFVRDLGIRVAMTSVSPHRQVMESLVALSYEKLLDFIFAQSHTIFVAEDEGRRVGFLLLLDALPDEVSMAPQAFVAYMAVEPDVQRRGIGRALLNAAEGLARERGLPTIAMMVTESNVPALDLYTSSGYRTERRLLCKPLA